MMNSSTTIAGSTLRHELNGFAAIRLALAYAVATNGMVVTPFIVSAIMLRFHLDESASTQVVGIEILGLALSCAFLPRWITRAAQAFSVVGVSGTIAAQALSAAASTVTQMSVARGMAGLFEGVLFVVVASGISHRAGADRLWGLVNLLAGGINGSILVVASFLPEAWLGRWLFLLLVGLIALMAPMIVGIHHFAARHHGPRAHASLRPPVKLVLAIWVITILIYGAQASQWAVAGFVGTHSSGLSSSTIGILLSVSSLLGFAGAIIPAQRASQAHRLKLIWLAQLVMIGAIIEFFRSTSAISYFLSQLVLNCAFFVVIPFLTGLLSEIDLDGSLVARTVVVTFIGAAGGTAMAGGLFSYYGGPHFSYALGIGVALAFPFVLMALNGASRHRAVGPAHQLSS